MKGLLLFFSLAVAASAAVFACSSDKTPGASSGGAVPPPPLVPPPPGPAPDGGDDGGTPTCYDGPLDAGPVAITVVESDTPPTPTGGTIAPGTYFLTTSEIFLPTDAGNEAGPNGSVVYRHVVVGAKSWDYAECEGDDAGIDECDKQTRTWTTTGTQLTFTQQCPGPVGAMHTVQYSVIGDELHVFPTPNEREIHKRQP